jgi:hypothetical protein
MFLLLKWRVWLIERDLRRLRRSEGVKPRVWSFGSYHIDPKHLVIVVGVSRDSERNRLRTDSTFQDLLKGLLVRYGWSESAQKHVHFDIESQETVDREDDGRWWYHYK